MPLGAFVSSREIMQTLTFDPPLGHITTFGGHPVSCAAGLAAQQFIEKNGLVSKAVKLGKLYRKILKHHAIENIRGQGLFLAVVVKDEVSVSEFLKAALEEGLIIDMFLFSKNAFRIAPPLIITEEQVRLTVEKIMKTLDRLAG